ncbi:4-carboxy-4-hydroxy-2-oxoadipate aldolase/oxaloacetate decarboxylase [Sphaerobacter thermophilus]|uniref:4-hydroxy-4-methyl-2-oxoglutarate aldolase n=1 Tax=Sphaerobacter thermophilus (strain ATCC 49802 / DSM 20745 / KCCM 41009 / NCIMB 13125 / S 6022) TaxID=479434 RepID=D1C8W5_SPHTD|nr:4-carboxy-4-hydroxy-2-oxoadipate aldolase/oxaloacetate decarboxylase [Sphaerobacter thermophilus]ACZ40258.1 Dimethylmenaquinone methyltransferase [Sphaerobacter thermophilus DSM 20745]
MKPCVIPTIERPDPAAVQALAGHGVATVHEAMGRQGLLDVAMRPIKEGWSICGPPVTSLNHVGDNLMIHAALDVCQPGDVLVITTTAPTTCGMVGELLARQAKVRGVAGIIIEGGVRDVADLRRLDLPIWSTAISAAGTVKATPGWVNVPVVCCGVHIRPGDIVVADDDGVVVVPRETAAQVAEAAAARTAREEVTRGKIMAGELSLDLHGLRQYLADKGVTWTTPK